MRHKQSIGKTVLLDNIDPEIIARLADLGIDYYAYSHYNLTTIIHIIKYFWFVVLQTTTPTSPTPSSTVSDQVNSHRIYNSSHSTVSPSYNPPPLRSQTLMVLSFSIKVQPHPSGPVLYKNMYNNTNLLVLFYLKVLTTINYSPSKSKPSSSPTTTPSFYISP